MNDRDELDSLFAELGTATPDPGFDQRVLRGIERRRMSAEPKQNPSKFFAFGLAGALALMIAGVALFLVHRGTQTVATTRTPVPIQTGGPQRLKPDLRAGMKGTPEAVPLSRANRNLHSTQKWQQVQAVESGGADLAISYPAPEAPLTQQERLLLRLVHGHDSVEEAMLKTDALPLEEARARDEFQRFFPPPDPPANDVLPAQIPPPNTNSDNKAAKDSTKDSTKDSKGDVK